eukprot:2016122-Pleurochrysis_carterae.AAC.2
MVSSTSVRFGVSLDVQLSLCSAVLRATHPNSLSSPALIHAASWASERRLYHHCALLSAAVLSDAHLDAMISRLDVISRTRGAAALGEIDVCIVQTVMEAAFRQIEAISAPGDAAQIGWRSVLARCRAMHLDLHALIIMITQNEAFEQLASASTQTAWAPSASASSLSLSSSSSSRGARSLSSMVDKPEEKWQMLLLLQVVAREVILTSDGFEQTGAEHSFWAYCAAAANLTRSFTSPHFHALLKAGAQLAHGDEIRFSGLVRSLIDEVVLCAEYHNHGNRCVELPLEIADLLARLAVGSRVEDLPVLTWPSRLLVLGSLTRYSKKMSSLQQALLTIPRLGGDGCELWLRQREVLLRLCCAESSASPPPLDGVQVAAATSLAAAVDTARSGADGMAGSLASSVDALGSLEAVAVAKIHISSFIDDLVLELRSRTDTSASAKPTELPATVSALLLHSPKLSALRVYALRSLWARGGVGLLARLFTLPVSALQWLPVDASACTQLGQAEPLLDPFRWLLDETQARPGRAYAEIEKLVRELLFNSSKMSKLELEEAKKKLDALKGVSSVVAVAAARCRLHLSRIFGLLCRPLSFHLGVFVRHTLPRSA